MSLAVLLYESADDVLEKVPRHMPAHLDRIRAFAERGDIIMIGPFGDPQREGSMAIFRTRAAAEAFAEGDPFVRNGVVRAWALRDWNEILSQEAAAPAG